MHAPFDEIPSEMEVGEIRTRGVEWGDQLVRWISLPAGVDFTPLFVGLPDDRCQCPHSGYVIDGSITIRYADGTEETCRAGDAYHWPTGHNRLDRRGCHLLGVQPGRRPSPGSRPSGSAASARHMIAGHGSPAASTAPSRRATTCPPGSIQ